jgi:hypothetical protein
MLCARRARIIEWRKKNWKPPEHRAHIRLNMKLDLNLHRSLHHYAPRSAKWITRLHSSHLLMRLSSQPAPRECRVGFCTLECNATQLANDLRRQRARFQLACEKFRQFATRRSSRAICIAWREKNVGAEFVIPQLACICVLKPHKFVSGVFEECGGKLCVSERAVALDVAEAARSSPCKQSIKYRNRQTASHS